MPRASDPPVLLVKWYELATLLGVHESQVSRDERNEYGSITVERASRILEALGVELVSGMKPGPKVGAV
jgi:transcriptional regulator with XRE-family HTH domain